MRKEIGKMCDQLIITDSRITNKLDLLFKDFHERVGQKTAVRWLPIIIGAVVNISTLAGVFYAVSKAINP